MTKSRICVAPFLLVILLAVLCGQEVTAQDPLNDIRKVDFKNFTFSRSQHKREAEVIQFRRGEYVGLKGLSYFLMRFAYGDLTGDGNEEVVILLRGQNSPMSRTLDEVFIYTLENRRVVLLTSFKAGKRGGYVCSVLNSESNFKVEDNLLMIDLAVALEGDINLIPTRYYTITYHWDGEKMEETGRSALKPLPEHRREIG